MIPFNNPQRGQKKRSDARVQHDQGSIFVRIDKRALAQMTEAERAKVVQEFSEAIASVPYGESKPTAGRFKVGARIWFERVKIPYIIRAQSERYVVCTVEDDPSEYTVLDLVENVRGIENLVRQEPTDSERECRAMIERLEGTHPTFGIQTEISTRTKIPLRIAPEKLL